jgi:hypothetical protein
MSARAAMLRALCFACALAGISAHAARAQDAPRRQLLCVGGRPLSHCRIFGVTEVAYHLRDDPPGRGVDPYVSWTYGAMVNVTGRSAVGATLMLSALSNGPSSHGRTAWLLRYRRWIAARVGVDAALGSGTTADDDPERWRPSASLGMSVGDYVGVFGQVEGSHEGAKRSGGFKLGSWPGLVLGAAALSLYLMIPPS